MNLSDLFLLACLALASVLSFLKATKRIRLPWLWVLSPVWLPLLLGIVAAMLLPIILKS